MTRSCLRFPERSIACLTRRRVSVYTGITVLNSTRYTLIFSGRSYFSRYTLITKSSISITLDAISYCTSVTSQRTTNSIILSTLFTLIGLSTNTSITVLNSTLLTSSIRLRLNTSTTQSTLVSFSPTTIITGFITGNFTAITSKAFITYTSSLITVSLPVTCIQTRQIPTYFLKRRTNQHSRIASYRNLLVFLCAGYSLIAYLYIKSGGMAFKKSKAPTYRVTRYIIGVYQRGHKASTVITSFFIHIRTQIISIRIPTVSVTIPNLNRAQVHIQAPAS